MLNKEELLGAIARGWCHEKNESKTMDSDLALAIADEVESALRAQADARPVAWSEHDIATFAATFGADPKELVRAVLRQVAAAHPEASAPGLSEDDIYDALVMRCESDGTPCEPEVLSNFARCISDLTRASAQPSNAEAPGLSDEAGSYLQDIETLMKWHVRNVKQWSFPEYDQAHRAIKKLRAILTRASASTETTGLMPHEIAKIVNQVRDIAKEFHDTQQLRARIAGVLVPVLTRANAATVAEPSKRTANEIVAEQQRTHEFVQFADRTRYVANIDPKKGIEPYPEAAQQQAEPKRCNGAVGNCPNECSAPCSQQAEPGADERALTDQEIADLGPGEVTTWAYEDMFYFARKIEAAVLARTAQSGQRAGVAELHEIADNITANAVGQPKTDWGDGYRQACTDIAGGLRMRANAATPTQQQEEGSADAS